MIDPVDKIDSKNNLEIHASFAISHGPLSDTL